MVDPERELDRILSEPIESAKRRELTTFDGHCAIASEIILHGCGGLGRSVLAGLRNIGIEPAAFTDRNEAAWDKTVDGVSVLSPQDAASRFGGRGVFVVCIWSAGMDRSYPVVAASLAEVGCRNVVSFIPLFWKYPDQFLPYHRIDQPHKVLAATVDVRRAFELFADAPSREAFVEHLQWMISCEPSYIPPRGLQVDAYFHTDAISLGTDEVFVDCGAYNGDTLRGFIEQTSGRFSFAYAFEPDPRNADILARFVHDLPADVASRVRVYANAVGSERKKLRFDAQASVTSTVSTSGAHTVDSVRLDDVLEREPTYIKMDVEGYEIEALMGGADSITRSSPKLAISAYHLQDHLWRIPILISSFSDRYRFTLRRHGDAFDDIVCYAVCAD